MRTAQNELAMLLAKHSDEVSKAFYRAVAEKIEDEKVSMKKETEDKIFNSGLLDTYTYKEVTEDTTAEFKNIYALIQSFEGLLNKNKKLVNGVSGSARVKEEGAKLGFSEEDSMFIFSMCRYKQAIQNIESQRSRTMELLLSAASGLE